MTAITPLAVGLFLMAVLVVLVFFLWRFRAACFRADVERDEIDKAWRDINRARKRAADSSLPRP